ncbi:MAG: sigma-70 family RNA polymerase sigma factor [Bacteroidota bacterium]
MLLTQTKPILQETPESDEKAIAQAKEDPKAFEILYKKYYAEIFRFVDKKVMDKNDTADIVSRVFVKSFNQIHHFQYKGIPYSAWLYRVAINEANQYFNNSKTRHVVIDDHLSSSIAFELNTDHDKQQLIDQLPAALNRLKPLEIELIELRFYEGMSYKQIGEILNMSENTSKVKTFRALKKLKKVMNNG